MGKISRILAAGLCLLWMGAAMTTSTTKTRTYAADDSAFPNAQIGYAPMIDTAEAGDAALRYLELTWREAEPEEGVYAWEAISEKYDFASLREQGIHLVLRFVCDVPGQETHLDIPDWLYAQTKDGSWYDTDYGKGYSPNYANVVFRAAHHRVLYALSSGTSHSAQFAMAAMLKAANEGKYNFLDEVKVYGERARRLKEIFLRHGFHLVYDNDLGDPVADGFYFTIGYPGMSSGELAKELMYYGVSAISLVTTGSHQEGLRACTSFIQDHQYDQLDERMAIFAENHPIQ